MADTFYSNNRNNRPFRPSIVGGGSTPEPYTRGQTDMRSELGLQPTPGDYLLTQCNQGKIFGFSKKPGTSLLESASKMIITDLIGEGPIKGFVDDLGFDIDIDPTIDSIDSSEEIFKGIYYNDIPVKDTYTNEINWNGVSVRYSAGYSFNDSEVSSIDLNMSAFERFGLNINKIPFDPFNVGIITDYSKKLYPVRGQSFSPNLLSAIFDGAGDIAPGPIPDMTNQPFVFLRKDDRYPKLYGGNAKFGDVEKLLTNDIFRRGFGVAHEINDMNVGYVSITFQQDALYHMRKKNGALIYKVQDIAVTISYLGEERPFAIVLARLSGACTSPYEFDLNLNLVDAIESRVVIIKVFNISPKISMTETRDRRELTLVKITEYQRSKFTYPNSAYIHNIIDSRNVSQVPNRSYMMKLLKVKVPNNYDAETKTYFGEWDGNFSSSLQWTNNPAWILYDIVTNNRYGVGRFTSDSWYLNKWSIYELAKYCDEKVQTRGRSLYSPVKVRAITPNNIWIGTALSGDQSLAARQWSAAFPSINNQAITVDYRIYVVSIINVEYTNDEGEVEYKNYEAVILDSNPAGANVTVGKLIRAEKIMSSFDGAKGYLSALRRGLKKGNITEKEFMGPIYSAAKNKNPYGRDNPNLNVWNDGSTTSFALGPDATQFVHRVAAFIRGDKNYSDMTFPDSELPVIPRYITDNYISGSAEMSVVFNSRGFSNLLESRFSCDIYLQDPTEIFDLINNIASCFRGISYWNNFSVNVTTDRKKDPVYSFTNANVKNGIFNYFSAGRDTKFTVCKVTYSDASDNYRDKTVYVEDYKAIRDYGYIEKEILGFGITSIGQARRVGKWFLITNQVETELVSFTTSQEALFLDVGDVITISDRFKTAGPKAGRVVKTQFDPSLGHIITLDNRYDFIQPNDVVGFQVVTSTTDEFEKAKIKGTKTSYIHYLKVDEVELSETDDDFKTQIKVFITNQKDRNAFAQIQRFTLWFFEEAAGSDLNYNLPFRVSSIKEKPDFEFEIEATQYNRSKFDHIDFNEALELPTLVEDENSSEVLSQSDFHPQDLLDAAAGISSDARRAVFIALFNGNSNGSQPFQAPVDYYVQAEKGKGVSFDLIFDSYIFNPSRALDKALNTGTITQQQFDETEGLLVSLIICGRRITFRWYKTDVKDTFNIAIPIKIRENVLLEVLVYRIGKNKELL